MSFMDQILEQPDDDGPRLVFADWLEEQGDSRGEFIRVQCALAKLGKDDERRLALHEREQRLLLDYRSCWDSPLRDLADGWDYQRGFAETVRSNTRLFLSRAGTLFRTAPVRSLELHDIAGLLPALARTEELNALQGLTIFAGHNSAIPHALAGSPYLSRLDSLRLGRNNIDDHGAEALAASPGLQNLRELDLAENHLGPTAAQALAANTTLSRLKRLNLRGNNIGPAGVLALIGVTSHERLTCLQLAQNFIGPAIISQVASNPALKRLTELDLGHNDLGERGVATLAESQYICGLKSLGLAGNDIGPEGLDTLLKAGSLRQLRRLDLAGNRINDAALTALASNGAFPRLIELDLRDNPFRGIGIRALIHAPLNRPITRLRLSQVQVDPWLLKPLQQRYGSALRIE